MRAESRFCESWNQMHKIAESNAIFAESSAQIVIARFCTLCRIVAKQAGAQFPVI